MEVYEVMLFAMPLWFGMIFFFFTLVFGRDCIAYFSTKGASLKREATPRPITEKKVPVVISSYQSELARVAQHELVAH